MSLVCVTFIFSNHTRVQLGSRKCGSQSTCLLQSKLSWYMFLALCFMIHHIIFQRNKMLVFINFHQNGKEITFFFFLTYIIFFYLPPKICIANNVLSFFFLQLNELLMDKTKYSSNFTSCPVHFYFFF